MSSLGNTSLYAVCALKYLECNCTWNSIVFSEALQKASVFHGENGALLSKKLVFTGEEGKWKKET